MTAPATHRTTLRLLPALLLERGDAIVLPTTREPADDGLVLVIGADLEGETVTLVTEDLSGAWLVDYVAPGRTFAVVRTA